MRSVPLLAVLIVATTAHTHAQQQVPPVAPGQRVRVTCPTAGLWQATGNFQRMENDSLILLIHPQRVSSSEPGAVRDSTRIVHVPASGVTSLEAYRGRSTSAVRILAMSAGGLALGAGIGWGIGKAVDESYPEGGLNLNLGQAWGAGIGAAVGFFAGVVTGSLIKSDKWEEVPLDRLHVSVGPQRGGFGIGASIAF